MAQQKKHKRHSVHAPSHTGMRGPGRTGGLEVQPLRRVELTLVKEAPAQWPSISACLIVKNEAANLPDCLKSLEDLASEVIVVDTGSTDDTVPVAQSLGAKVFHFPWTGDFAGARNESLRHAGGEWVFWLDADDRLSPQAVARLKRASSMDVADAYMCLVSSKTAAGGHEVTEHIRLFRNGLGIRFSGAIHETVFHDLLRQHRRLVFTDVVIAHLGYQSPEAVKEKSARNLQLIEAALASKPSHLDLVFYRGQSRANLGDFDGAQADMVDFLARTRPDPVSELKRFWAYSLLCTVHERRGDSEAAEAVLKRALAEFPGHPQFLASLAGLRLADGRVVEAGDMLQRVHRALQEPVRGSRPPEASIELCLARCHRAQGQKEQAVRWAEQAMSHAPQSREIAMTLARLYLEAGSLPQAEIVVQQLLEGPDSAEGWLLLAEVRYRQGRPEEAAGAIDTARDRGLPEDKAAEMLGRLKASVALSATRSHHVSQGQEIELQIRGLALLGQKDYLQAADCFGKSIEMAPSNPDNYRYLALALRGLGREEEAMEAWQLAGRWDTLRGQDNRGFALSMEGTPRP